MRVVSILFSLLILGTAAEAKPIITNYDRVDIDWSLLRIRFYGESKVDPSQGASFKDAEKEAWQEGLNYIVKAVVDIRKSRDEFLKEAEEVSVKAANAVASSTYSTNTIYYASGKVRVELESSLARALMVEGVNFSKNSLEEFDGVDSSFSGLLVKVHGKMEPIAYFKIVSADGDILYQAKDIAKDAYEKRLMAKWLYKPSSYEVKRSAGSSPLEISGSVKGDSIVVDADSWHSLIKGNEKLIASGEVVVALY